MHLVTNDVYLTHESRDKFHATRPTRKGSTAQNYRKKHFDGEVLVLHRKGRQQRVKSVGSLSCVIKGEELADKN
jgi:hypothetical protein